MLTLALAQPPCLDLDVAANARAHAAAVRAARARVVLFPELSLTGYVLETTPVEMSELAPVVEACAETGCLALVGAPAEGFLAVLAVDGSGVRIAYRKIYLGDDEARHFKPGPEPVVLELDGWRLGLAVCKDLGTPAHAAATAALGMDAYLAGTVKHDHELELQDERARRLALEHGVWVAVASFAGPTGEGYHRTAGRSALWSPSGEVVVRAGSEPGLCPVVGQVIRP